jgi:hypothetical protein
LKLRALKENGGAQVKKWTLVEAIIGFALPIFGGGLGFVSFTAPQSIWTDLFWKAVHITCPLWDVPGTLLTPFLNAGLYGLIAFLIGKLTAGRAAAS